MFNAILVSMIIHQQHVKILSHPFICLCPPSVAHISSTPFLPRFKFLFPTLTSFSRLTSLSSLLSFPPCFLSSSAVLSSRASRFNIPPPHPSHLPPLPPPPVIILLLLPLACQSSLIPLLAFRPGLPLD